MKDLSFFYKDTNELNNKLNQQEFLTAQKNLLLHVSNKDNYRTQQYKVYSGANIKKNFSSQNQRRSYFLNCTINDSSFRNCGLSGSYFINCIFENCELDYSFFDNCYFFNCEFNYSEYKEIMSASFCNSIFIECTIHDCCFHSCSFTNATFNDTLFKQCILDDIVWENAKIYSCKFNSVKLLNLNIEFVCFENNTLTNTILPFASIPFSFKCIEYLLSTKDDVRISSERHSDGLTKEYYIDRILPQLICFYKYTNNYFPLANILASIGKIEESLSVIIKSIPFLVRIHEFRTLKYISILMQNHDFSNQQKNQVYQLINNELFRHTLTQEDYWLNAEVYLFEIRNNLLNGPDKEYVTIELFTNINKSSTEKLNILINKIEELFNSITEKETHFIEYRHNSPFQFLITAFSSPEGIIQIISIFYLSLLGIDKFYNKYLDTKQKRLNITKTELEIQEMKDKKCNQGNVNNSSHNIEKDYVKDIHKELSDNNIQIKTVYHNVYNIDVSYYGSEFQHFTNE